MNMSYLRKPVHTVSKITKCYITAVRTLHRSQILCGSCHLEHSPNAKLNKSILDKYMCLPIPECKVQAKYIWIDGTGDHMRSKTKTLDFIPTNYKEVPIWTFDGSATFHSNSRNSDTYLCPVAMYNDPIRRGNNKLVLCETYTPEHKPTRTNHRAKCVEMVNCACEAEPIFGFEQEYQFLDVDMRMYGWPIMLGHPPPTGQYYCGVGAHNVYCREIVEAHYRACLYAGIQLAGTHAEQTLSQWEFQIGPSAGIKAADDLWTARFLLHRIAEEYGVVVSLDPKIDPHWKGASCCTDFSTKETRAENGITALQKAICLLEKKHAEHLRKYDPNGGMDNIKRLTGKDHAADVETFTHGVANRDASIRIPSLVAEAKKGHLQDRRPASNCDPYSVIQMLIKTVILQDSKKK